MAQNGGMRRAPRRTLFYMSNDMSNAMSSTPTSSSTGE